MGPKLLADTILSFQDNVKFACGIAFPPTATACKVEFIAVLAVPALNVGAFTPA